MSKFWQTLFFASIIISSISITTLFITPQVIYADENSVCAKNQFYYFGKCYANDTNSVPASTCGMYGKECASMPCPHGYTFAPNYTNGILTGFQCANLSNCPSGTVSHDNACIAIETGDLVHAVDNSTTVSSPLKQFKSGIAPNDISCKTGFVLVIKSEDSSPACVMPSSSARLLAQGWITPEKFLAQRIPSPKGYLGADFTSSGTVFPLIQGMTPNIPQSAATGYFSFLFSNSYPQDVFSISYQSCTRILNSEIQQNCDLAKSLEFSYGKNSQGQYVVTTKSVTLPCGSLQSYHESLIPTKYYYAIFLVRTLNFTTAAHFSYGYTVFANC